MNITQVLVCIIYGTISVILEVVFKINAPLVHSTVGFIAGGVFVLFGGKKEVKSGIHKVEWDKE